MIILIWGHKNEDIEKVAQNIRFYLINMLHNISFI